METGQGPAISPLGLWTLRETNQVYLLCTKNKRSTKQNIMVVIVGDMRVEVALILDQNDDDDDEKKGPGSNRQQLLRKMNVDKVVCMGVVR